MDQRRDANGDERTTSGDSGLISPGSQGGSSLELQKKFTAAREGSSEALGELLESCRNYLLLIANQAIKKGLQAKVGGSDLVQETFAEAQRVFGRFHGENEEELIRWLTRILEFKIGNTLKKYFGTEQRDPRRERDWYQLFGGGHPQPGLAIDASPSREAREQEDRKEFDVLISQLTPDQQNVVRMRIEEELSFEEIGTKLNRSGDASRKLFARAIVTLQGRRLTNDDEREQSSGGI